MILRSLLIVATHYFISSGLSVHTRQTCTHTLSLSLSRSRSRSRSLALLLSLSLSLSSFSLNLFFSFTHSLTHKHSLSLSLSLSYTQTIDTSGFTELYTTSTRQSRTLCALTRARAFIAVSRAAQTIYSQRWTTCVTKEPYVF